MTAAPAGFMLTEEQERLRSEFAAFVQSEIAPHAEEWDRRQELAPEIVSSLAARGYLGAALPREHGGDGHDAITFGLLNEALGSGCGSTRSLLTVHSMVGRAIARWGSAEQRKMWLPRMAKGTTIGAFALTEPEAGSDVTAISASARRDDDGFVLDGVKRWVTYGQRAGLFLVFAYLGQQATAFVVERDRPGIKVVPISGMVGMRASMLAELRFTGCRLPADALVGRPGFGLLAVAADALELGRYSVAWGSVGLAQACLDATLAYADQRQQFHRRLRDHQLVQRMIAEMVTGVTAARLLCCRAGWLREAGDPQSVPATWIAKYFAADHAFLAARHAVQCLGANGCSDVYPVQRHLRDAKVMEIIEGSTEMQQTVIAQSAYHHRSAGPGPDQHRAAAADGGVNRRS